MFDVGLHLIEKDSTNKKRRASKTSRKVGSKIRDVVQEALNGIIEEAVSSLIDDLPGLVFGELALLYSTTLVTCEGCVGRILRTLLPRELPAFTDDLVSSLKKGARGVYLIHRPFPNYRAVHPSNIATASPQIVLKTRCLSPPTCLRSPHVTVGGVGGPWDFE